jgi:hypothetical protein
VGEGYARTEGVASCIPWTGTSGNFGAGPGTYVNVITGRGTLMGQAAEKIPHGAPVYFGEDGRVHRVRKGE